STAVMASANGLGPVVTANLAPVATSSLIVHGATGADVLNVFATPGTDTITASGTSVAIAGFKTVNYSTMEAMNVFGREGSDNFTVAPSGIPIFIDGGDPIGLVPGD